MTAQSGAAQTEIPAAAPRHWPVWRISITVLAWIAILLSFAILRGNALEGALVALCFVLFAASIPFGFKLDELETHARKWALYWGGGLGLLAGIISAQVATGAISTFWLDLFSYFGLAGSASGVQQAFFLGALHVVACLSIGYQLAWVGWWIAKRG